MRVAPLTGYTRVPPTVRGALLRDLLLVAGAGAGAGAGLVLAVGALLVPAAALPLPAAGVALVGLLVLAVALPAAIVAGRRLLRAWDAVAAAIAQVAAAAEDQLIPRDTRLPEDSPLAPLAGTLTRMGHRVRELGTQLQMQADQARDIASQIGRVAGRQNAAAAAQATAVSEVATAITELELISARVTFSAHQVSGAAEEMLEAAADSRAAIDAALGLLGAANPGLDQTTLSTTLTRTAADLAAIAERTQQLAASIDHAMFQQGTSAAAVSQAINNIAETAEGMRTQTQAMAGEATQLIEVVRQLRQAAGRFGAGAESGHLLRMLMSGRETMSNRGLAWRALVDAWNSTHPGQSIALQFVPPGDYPADLQRALAAGTAADIVEVTNGTTLARYGYLAPLDSLLSPGTAADFYPALLDAGRYDGRLYSVPTEAQPLILLYNRRLFADLDVAPPRTWDELIAAAARCQTPDRWGLVLETAPTDLRTRQWLPFVWQGGGALGDDPATLGLDAPPARAALAFWHALVVERGLVPRACPHPVADIANLVEGFCAMQYTGAWALTALRARHPDFPYGVLDLPVPPGGRPATALLRWGLAINARSTHREVALSFVRWALAAGDPDGLARARDLTVEGLPVRRSVARALADAGRMDPAWRTLVEQVYPHARPAPDWTPATAAALTHALDAALAPPVPALTTEARRYGE